LILSALNFLGVDIAVEHIIIMYMNSSYDAYQLEDESDEECAQRYIFICILVQLQINT